MGTVVTETTASGNRKRAAEIARRLGQFTEDRRDFTTGATVVETLVATILSQNTNDRNSHRAYRQLVETYPDWDAVAGADAGELAGVIRPAGLARQKAATIIGALRTIQERYGSLIPGNLEKTGDDPLIAEMRSIPGVGLKTAACVLMFSLGRDICPVDTHVHRVVNRLGLVRASTPDRTFGQLRGLIPKGGAAAFHVGLIIFGRTVCMARVPRCFECPMYDLCRWKERDVHAKGPVHGAKPVGGDFLLMDHL